MQLAPPSSGRGLLHARVLDQFPESQAASQAHVDQADQTPSTEESSKSCLYSYSIRVCLNFTVGISWFLKLHVLPGHIPPVQVAVSWPGPEQGCPLYAVCGLLQALVLSRNPVTQVTVTLQGDQEDHSAQEPSTEKKFRSISKTADYKSV